MKTTVQSMGEKKVLYRTKYYNLECHETTGVLTTVINSSAKEKNSRWWQKHCQSWEEKQKKETQLKEAAI